MKQKFEPIAVVGVSALFPGSVDKTGFWRDILAGRDLVTGVPPSHWLVEDYYDPDPTKPDKTYAKRGAFLSDVSFDPMEWGIPPSIVPQTDTTQLLALIVAKAVLDDAVRGPNGEGGQFANVDRSKISCILGVTSGQELMGSMVSRLQRPVWVKALREAGLPESKVVEACDRISASYTKWEEANFPGLLGNVVAGRIANRLDIGGTNCVTDAACASTFSALSMGVNELVLGQSDLAIVGGCDTMNDIFMYMCFSKTPALSLSGDCRPFSDDADGTMLGEGIGMVALERLSDAEKNGRRIYAVIRGVGSGSDGKALSVYAPLAKGQARAVRRAYEVAGYGPETVELVEAHGTGTKAGDAAEFDGLKTVFGETGRTDAQWCALGSVKSQIGHTKSAAGAASFIKTVLALHHKTLPPTLKVRKPNPKMGIEASPFYLNTEARPWVSTGAHPRRAGVSSFGFGGTNFHIAVEEYRGPAERSALRQRGAPTELVVVGAESGAALKQALLTMASEVDRAVAEERAGMLRYLARSTASAYQPSSKVRAAVVAETEADLVTKLRSAADLAGKGGSHALPSGIFIGEGAVEGDVAFLFPGQGSQYVGMGRDLAMTTEVARGAWDLAARTAATAGERLDALVFPRPVFDDDARKAQQTALTATERAQPAIGVASLATLRTLTAIGLTPRASAGHSFGEVMALHAAGVISETDMLEIAKRRGARMADAARSTEGAMLAVVESADALRARIAGWGLAVVVANDNAPDQSVLSGPVAAIADAETRLRAAKVTCKRLEVATAFHSDIVRGAIGPFAQDLAPLTFSAPKMPVYANATAAPYSGDAQAMKRALAEQLGQPVRFVESVEAMYAAGARTFVEVGPSAVLTGLVGKILGKKPHHAIATDKKGQHGETALAHALGRLVAAGVPMDLAKLWLPYEDLADPRARPLPKMVIKLNGSNYNKPYPPKGGAAALPKPNPEILASAPAVAFAPASRPESAPESATGIAAARGSAIAVASGTSANAPQPSISASNLTQTPVKQMTQERSGLAVSTAWVAAFQETQRQTAEAHTAFARSMADAHTAFLRSAESSFEVLARMVGAAPAVSSAQQSFTPSVQPRLAQHEGPSAPVRSSLPSSVPQPTFAAPVSSPPRPAPSALTSVATPPRAPAAAPNVAPAVDLMALMLEVVAQKTGYPAEMIGMEMELEADLGIDSIKRVEILSAVRERAPGLPDLDPAALGALRTVGQIVDHLKAHLPASSEPAGVASARPVAAAAAPAVDLMALMLEVVAQKTGYPAEMIGMEMELEADLGIDSIKRVEILSAVRERAPGLPDLDPAALGALRTVGQIVDHLKSHLPASTASVASDAGATTPAVDLMALMLEVVAQKTGYPAEMIGMEMELEADLGIDSIKRVEILSAVRERAPGLPDLDPAALGALRTVGQIVDHLKSHLPGASQPAPPALSASSPLAKMASKRPLPMAARWGLRAVPRAAAGLIGPGLLSAARIVVTDDGAGIAGEVVLAFGRRALRAEVVREVPADADAVIFLGGLRDVSSADEAYSVPLEGFRAAKAVAARMTAHGGFFATVQDTGGDFALSGSPRAWVAGLTGLAKTAAQEWPKATCRSIDIARGASSAAETAERLVLELVLGGAEAEVGLRDGGVRVVLESVPAPIERKSAIVLGSSDVVLASGGARGVTATTLIALAKASQCKFVLLGRSSVTEEAASTRNAPDEATLKRALLEEAKALGKTVTPAEVGKRTSEILAGREILATLGAIEAAGGTARYVACNVEDAARVSAVLSDVRKTWGPVTAVVHGAGVIADKLIADKTEEQARRVLGAKVLGLRALLSATASDPLKAIVLFSSVAARTGNRGQCDYAMANEILNAVACAESARRKGCIVRALGWGPWEGGMVTPALKARFEDLGVPLVSLAVGAQMMIDELSSPADADVQVVLGGEPRAEALLEGGAHARTHMFELRVDQESHAFVASHLVKGAAVLPAVSAVELFARAAKALRPALTVTAIRDLQVLKGILLSGWEGAGDRFTVRAELLANGSGATWSMAVLGAGGIRHYAAKVEMHAVPGQGAERGPDLGPLTPWADTIYDGVVLFHGPALQAVRSVEGESERGIAAKLAGRGELGWRVEGATVTDTALLDGAIQVAVLWAKHALGGASLPTSIGSVLLHRGAGELAHARCVAVVRDKGRDKATFDVALLDERGAVRIELKALEVHVRPGSRDEVTRADA